MKPTTNHLGQILHNIKYLTDRYMCFFGYTVMFMLICFSYYLSTTLIRAIAISTIIAFAFFVLVYSRKKARELLDMVITK